MAFYPQFDYNIPEGVSNMNNLTKLWNDCLADIEEIVDDPLKFEHFFKPTQLLSYENGIAKIVVEMQLNKIVLENETEIFKNAISYRFEEKCREVQIILKDELENQNQVPEHLVEIQSNLKDEFTFEEFVVGTSNKVAQAASLAVAINPGESFNPLFIYGNSGLGKTHLLNAIGNYVKKKRSNAKVLYIPCLDFVDDYINNIKNGKIDAFNEKYRSIDVLLVDDIQWLAGKEKSHEVFFQIFNRMILQKKQIVLTSDRMPQEIAGLEQRLVSRFNSGLSVGIDSPEFETALAILKKKLELRNFDMDTIDEDVLSFMASHFSGNVRDLEGAVNRLIFYSILENINRITMNVALEAFKDHNSTTTPGILTTEKIKKTVAEYYNLTLNQLVGKSRMSNITMARHIAMYLVRDLLNLSFIKIGEEFGGRDHSTVMSACDKVAKLLKKDEAYKEAIIELKTMLK